VALDALEMAIWSRRAQQLKGLVHHSDRGANLAIRYTERLAEAGAVRSVGSRGDSYDNALAETVVGLYKTELIRLRGPWRSLEQVELATAEWVDWWNQRRFHSADGDLPPAEYEALYYRQRDTIDVASIQAAESPQNSARLTVRSRWITAGSQFPRSYTKTALS
jgi:putative transposase